MYAVRWSSRRTVWRVRSMHSLLALGWRQWSWLGRWWVARVKPSQLHVQHTATTPRTTSTPPSHPRRSPGMTSRGALPSTSWSSTTSYTDPLTHHHHHQHHYHQQQLHFHCKPNITSSLCHDQVRNHWRSRPNAKFETQHFTKLLLGQGRWRFRGLNHNHNGWLVSRVGQAMCRREVIS